MSYTPGYTDYPTTTARPDAVGQVSWAQTQLIANYALDKYIAIDKEIQGGLHRVKYKSQLCENSYDGIFSSRRKKGMLVYVELNDDDSALGEYFSLVNTPGTTLANIENDWKSLGSPSDVVFTGYANVADLAARDALTYTASDDGKIVNVTDARTAQEVTNEDPIYSQTFLWVNPSFHTIYPYRDPNSHVSGEDSKLKASSNNYITADSLETHLANAAAHRTINDSDETGSSTSLYSSAKINGKFMAKMDEDTMTSLKAENEDLSKYFQNADGLWVIPDGGDGGPGLEKGDILSGGGANSFTTTP